MTAAFGLSLPQGVLSELAHVPPDAIPADVVGTARRAETLGFDSLWVSDHLLPIRKRDVGGCLEGWTLLSAVSQVTERVRLGQAVLCTAFRNPMLTAKMAATLDVLSSGRLVLGLGAGWYQREFEAYGYEFGPGPERRRHLRETIATVRELWQDGARLGGPGPLQRFPPILVGGKGPRLLELVAAHADIANFSGSLDDFVDASRDLDRACEAIGRDPAEIERTWLTVGLLVGETDRQVAATVERWRTDGHVRHVRLQHRGTPEQVAEPLRALVDAGCRELIVPMPGDGTTAELELFAGEVMPRVRA